MRTIPLLRPLLAALSIGALLVAAPACKKSVEKTGEAAAETETAAATPEDVVEENDNGSVTWAVTPEGQVKAIVKGTDGKPVTKNITGEPTWKASTGEKTPPVTLDEKSGYLVAVGP